MSVKRFLVSIFGGVMIASTAVTAQDYAAPPLSGIGFTNSMVFGEELAKSNGSYQRPNARLATPSARGVNLAFVASPKRRQANLQKFVSTLQSTDPKAASQLQAFFASNDVIGAMSVALGKFGLRTDNVADAYAVWWITAWQTTHGETSETPKSQALAVKRQAANALSAAPDYVLASDSAKQEFAETLLVQAAIIEASADMYKSNPAMIKRLAGTVRQAARSLKIDLDAMTLTEQGFVPSGKTGAADPAPGAPEQALAANAAATPPVAANEASPPYLLLAAAGGAGLGGMFMLSKMMGRRG
jgi:pyruvate/2-oxoglutarate dehydrogenase complex dihydrolipoamide acyltransferase (E2) component